MKKEIRDHFQRCKLDIIKIIHEFLLSCSIYLFGSRARGECSTGADVDIALDGGKPIEMRVMMLIRDGLEESTMPLMVDVVDLKSASEMFRKEIENERVLWASYN